jgi:hypothetical protein
MVLKCCSVCPHHSIRAEGEERHSHCSKENCWSRFSKCVTIKALERFLLEQSMDQHRPSAIQLAYSIRD